MEGQFAPENLVPDRSMPSTKQQRSRRQTAPSGPPRKPDIIETQPNLETPQEKPSNHRHWDPPSCNDELEFSEWFYGLKDGLVEESFDQYQYVQRPRGGCDRG